jgi:lipopolysaccharide/colanic/teichoic acid biosynthesis glycosyltransferase
LDQSLQRRISLDAEVCEEQVPARKPAVNARFSLHLVQERPSPWSLSGAKRLFDVLSVLTVLPLLAPIFLAVALAVRLTSSGPVLFLQKRTGCHGRTFTILKFRTMTHSVDAAHHAVTTTENQRFTPVGPFLRRWKLDELPQLLNVLVGDMSLVGARPKLPEHQVADLQCRPGITGAATVAFAHEAIVLAQVPKHHLDDYYREVVLPTKHQMDVEYMARATFLSDLKLLVNTLLCRWDRSACDSLINNRAFGSGVSREPIPIAFSIDV